MKIGKTVLAGVAAGVLCASVMTASVAQAEDERVRWNMASWFPSNLTQLGTLGKSMVDRLDRISGGNIQLKFFEPNALIPAKECFRRRGRGLGRCLLVDARLLVRARSRRSPCSPRCPSARGRASISAGFYYGGGYELWDAIYEPHGLKSLPCGVIAPEASGLVPQGNHVHRRPRRP